MGKRVVREGPLFYLPKAVRGQVRQVPERRAFRAERAARAKALGQGQSAQGS